MKLRYMIIGAGGVGGPVGAYLSKSGADTTLIARGKHLAVLQEHGLTLVSGENERESIPVKAIDMDGFLAAREQGAPAPDVIFVCQRILSRGYRTVHPQGSGQGHGSYSGAQHLRHRPDPAGRAA